MAQTQALTPFWPVFIARSDGKQEVIAKGARQKNGPSQAQLDRTPNDKGVCDYYRELTVEEPKHQDWRKKLGGMLVRELGDAAKATNTILWELPENYRLFEHIKSKADGEKKASKNHSGGGHDRQDAYLYGHPKGPKKRFRSPADFFPHLLWLVSDESGDPGNCSCKLCCPEQLDIDKPADTPTPTPTSKEGTPHATPTSAPPVRRDPIVQIPARRPSMTTTPSQSPAPAQAVVAPSNSPSVVRSRAPAPTPLPQPRNMDQQIDNQYRRFLGRTGEVVWYCRGEAWGLALIVRRWQTNQHNEQNDGRAYMLQPLSHPYHQIQLTTVTLEQHIRPWLAWSAPPCTYPYLREHQVPFDKVDWNGLLIGTYGNAPDGSQNAEVDASILAAKSVDSTYTLFEFIRSAGPNQEERHWNGLYLGGEKLWNGEPVRLRAGSGNDVLVITDIIERPTANDSGVFLVGDIYTLTTVDVPNPTAPPALPPNTALPIRMREDLQWRNARTLQSARKLSYWMLQATMAKHSLVDIRGRWYETSVLFPDQFQNALNSGKLGDNHWMNIRGEASGIRGQPGKKVDDRINAFGQSIPHGTTLVTGLEAPPISQQSLPSQQPQQQMHSMDSLPISTSGPDFLGEEPNFNDFLNLDSNGMDTAFGNDFGGGNFNFH